MSGECFPHAANNSATPAADAVAICACSRPVGGPGTRGGDFYARCETARGTRVIVGDVRGKGTPAARKARLLARAFVVIAASAGTDLEAVSCALDQLAAADAAGEWDLTAREWFATAVLLEIDRQGRRVTVINHGHPAPVLVDEGADGGAGTVRELVPSRPRLPLGLGDLVSVDGFADTVELAAHTTLLLFTDGLSEARDRHGRMFDPVAWLRGDLPRAADPVALLDSLLVEVERHNGGVWRDDLAMVSVRRRALPVRAAPPVPSSRVAPVTLPPAMVPAAPAARRPVAPSRPRAPRNPSRRPGGGWPSADGTSLP
jgi:serine phosphatase RsbU (regulator of sigma subunit)